MPEKLLQQKHELVKIHDLIHRRLLPELDELDRVIIRDTEDAIAELHPDLLNIIENRTYIREEAEEWLRTGN